MGWNSHFMTGGAGMTMVVILLSYLLGCLTTGYYIVKWKTGTDIRKTGSGNVGARNVGRVLGRWGFILTTLGDFTKGFLAVWLTILLTNQKELALLALIAVVAGHMWPLQLCFQGGKGICTSVGGLLLFPSLLGCFFLFFGVAYVVLRKTTLSGMVAYVFLPIVCLFLDLERAYLISFSILALLILFAHRNNVTKDVTLLLSSSPGVPKSNISTKKS